MNWEEYRDGIVKKLVDNNLPVPQDLEWSRIRFELGKLTGDCYLVYPYPVDPTKSEVRRFLAQEMKLYAEPEIKKYCLGEIRKLYGRN